MVFGPNLNGAMKFPFATQRQIVAGLTGSIPGLPLNVAMSLILRICFVMKSPPALLHGAWETKCHPINRYEF